MDQLQQKLFSIVKQAHRLETEPRRYGTDFLLSGTDIHLIEIIGDNDNVSVTDIARLFDVTKGAVSQKLKHLRALGLVQKSEDTANLSRSIISLTAQGMAAYLTHKQWHKNFDGGFQNYNDNLPDEQRIVILEYLSKIEVLLNRLLSVEE